jgi:cysteine-rich repeat protein
MVIYPDNAADPLYQFYVGGVTKIWCADFEAGIGDWTHSATPSTKDDWEAGAPQGIGGDPKAAHGGTGVLGNDLTSDGIYGTRITASTAASPEVDLMGHTQNVHLQYYRWLGVEDGFYDKATISANGTPVWRNFASANDPMTAEINHLDREWRFQDVDVSAQAASGKIKLSFGLTSDPGYQAGGWTIDDVCLVVTGPGAGCGNGQVDLNETCDDGNTADGDGCSASCQSEDTGGGGGGCCGVGTNPAAPIGLSVIALGLVLRRRRR